MLAILVVAVVALGRAFGDGAADQSSFDTGSSPAPVLSADPDDDDSVLSEAPPPSPSTSPGTAKPEAVAYAFASAWADHKNASAKAWHDGLVPNATQDLLDELDGTDPADVPVDRVLGRPSLVPIGAGLVDADVPVDSGKLTLRLVAPDGRWLVDGIDWGRS
ncbi:hypothetical protein [Mangrovihabitans endophyticus]|uniref:hypothetical protein n=1 Tax=Mangrovihabitans endophyticus TaxID=1751298 RepID=UPI001E6275AC|nr:hypothetical protein [Mangrovihabitans endophyticus]